MQSLLIGKESKTTVLIIEQCRQITVNGGRGLIINEVMAFQWSNVIQQLEAW